MQDLARQIESYGSRSSETEDPNSVSEHGQRLTGNLGYVEIPASDKEQIEQENRVPIGDCRAVRLNSGKFGVPWERTKRVLEEGPLDMVIVKPIGDDGPTFGKKLTGVGLQGHKSQPRTRKTGAKRKYSALSEG